MQLVGVVDVESRRRRRAAPRRSAPARASRVARARAGSGRSRASTGDAAGPLVVRLEFGRGPGCGGGTSGRWLLGIARRCSGVDREWTTGPRRQCRRRQGFIKSSSRRRHAEVRRQRARPRSRLCRAGQVTADRRRRPRWLATQGREIERSGRSATSGAPEQAVEERPVAARREHDGGSRSAS